MISPSTYYDKLRDREVDFFTGVPDSLLKDICAYIMDNTAHESNIIAANEGNAIALAAGYHLATNKIPMVYLQNSGIGNTINPLLSLVDPQVYNFPVLLMIGWRGEPGLKDEPQHVAQGLVTLPLLRALNIPYLILSSDEKNLDNQINRAIESIKKTNSPFAIVVRKNTFKKYSIKTKKESSFGLLREEVIEKIVANLVGDEVIVSTTGKTSRELYEVREKLHQNHCHDFLTVGSMGHSSQIALGIAINKKDRTVICIDGDGAMLMHMGSLAIIGDLSPNNYIHIVINNGAHESVGGQPTVSFGIDIPRIALASGYKSALSISNMQQLEVLLKDIKKYECPVMIEIKVKTGSRDDLGRPTIKPVDNKKDFMKNLMG
ncbi:MAG: phosphonopyruvate decarboxylase [Bacteroidetes bacterium]|nr:MAG: phosphonopyruvate decarboxylase [Bacteroidota bacterium]